MDKIGIIITTIHRDDMLMETLNSILNVWKDNWRVYIVDQNNEEDYSLEKTIFYKTACSQFHNDKERRLKVIKAPYDCGLSHARNLAVDAIANDGIPYCLISADSIKFTPEMQDINYLTQYLNATSGYKMNLLGLNLKDRVGWEAWLDMEDSFIINFINKDSYPDIWLKTPDKKIGVWTCDIVKNFFLATTESLSNNKWDDDLKMSEHEDFFWRYKQNGFKVSWTNLFCGEYIGNKIGGYGKLRSKNMRISKTKLLEKYNLKTWIKYINLDRAK